MTQTTETKQTEGNSINELRNKLKRAIIELTDDQAEYVLLRLQCITS